MQAKGIEPDKLQPYRRAAGEEFGRFVFRARQRAGLTQTQFAERLSMRQVDVSRLEKGYQCPRLDTVVRVIAALEADPRELVKAIADAYGL
jgi:transcriptional regulator with XRE-family HTH domain